MASLEGLKRRAKSYKPHIQSAFIVYVVPNASPVNEVDEQFDVVEMTEPNDPLLDQITQPWQRKGARKMLAAQRGRVILALADGKPVGRIWEIFETETGFFSGIPRVKLAKRETFMFDLFVDREFRRSNIGMTMADYFFSRYDHGSTRYPSNGTVDYVYGFVSYENAPSIMWHYSIGFNIVQTINYLSIGDRVKWKIPLSDMPRFGIMSRKGRHTNPEKKMFGTSLFPNL